MDEQVIRHSLPILICMLLVSIPFISLWHGQGSPAAVPDVTGLGPFPQDWDDGGDGLVLAPVAKKNAEVSARSASPPDETLPPEPNGLSPAMADEGDGDWRNQAPAQLWQRWQILLKQRNFQQMPIMGFMLAESLRKAPDPDVYQGIAALLAHRNIPVEGKALLVGLLGEIATPDSLTQLLQIAENHQSSPLYIPVLQVIAHIGDNRWDGRFHEELSPILEEAWNSTEIGDPVFIDAIANAIAVLGAPTGVYQLLSTVAGENRSNDSEDKKRIKQRAAFGAIPKTRNPGAVPTLSSWLNAGGSASTPSGATVQNAGVTATPTVVTELSGQALAEIGTPAATEAILTWAGTASGSDARLLEDWLSKINDAESMAMIASYAGGDISAGSGSLQSPEVADALNQFVSEMQSPAISASVSAPQETSGSLPEPALSVQP